MKTETATFAAGCFWGVEAAFSAVEGVLDAASGYMGGVVPDPFYELVCTGQTGYAEAVQVNFDPTRVTFEQLLDYFWQIHDPTTLNRQGPDVGSQYRSAIFYRGEDQRRAAEESKRRADASGAFSRPIVTEIVAASTFYRAEEYHQRYYEKMGIHTKAGVNLCAMPAAKSRD